ncbi:PfkB family carbohydrate kinase [Deinococcus navajonensis]|uniref:PfkB family carbohydrate kinase n=1 Tax=Deinococcus navajonensis TaxID=309884 RepID=A0ABV8XNZ7_9DEIO
MALTDREQQLLTLIRASPLSSPEELARRLGTSRAAVNVHVSSLVRKGALLGRGYILPETADLPRVVLVGGANMDLKARILGHCVPGTSNPGVTGQTPGGVARNIAENLGHLGVAVSLISAVGRDVLGDALLRQTEAAGVEVRGVLRAEEEATGTYTAVLDATGELVVAVAAMSVMDRLTPAAVRERRGLLRGAAWVVADGNLRPDTLRHLLELCAEAGVPVAFEPVSVPKAGQLRPALEAGLAPALVTPNVAELGALLGRDVPDTPADLRAAAQALHGRGVELVWVRRGPLGSLLSGPEGAQEFPALPAAVRDVTGAGDAMLAAFLAGLVSGVSAGEAARLGHAAAAATVESPLTVVPDLSLSTLRDRLN